MECPSCGNENRAEAKFCDSCGTRLEGRPAGEGEARTPDQQPAPIPKDGAPLPESIGEYPVERFLGERGRKRVYLAHEGDGGEPIAVAVFSAEGVEETVMARVRRETQAMGRLGAHPNIVAVHDTGEEDGSPFIVSEYMPGGDVETLLDRSPDRRLSIDRAIAIATDVCRGLEHAHAKGIVHRDLKPATVWLGEDDRARLGDFGLADTGGTSAGAEGVLVGTVAYLPPEQALGRASDARSDLYSLGALLYEMVAGQPPFPGDDAVAIITRHLNTEPVAPSRHNPEVPRALDALILRLLAKSPSERPESADEVRTELEAVAAAPPDEPESADPQENPLDRLAGGVFVGRERELDELRSGVDDALGGRGGLLMLVGEPGIGKTRTAEELATYAQVRGARVHWGRCHEGEGAPAYWPWAEAIRSYVREADPVGLAWELGAGAAEVAKVVPELREQLGDLPEPPELEPEQARFRLFDSIASFLTAASQTRPLVIVLDDLHWADEPSLLLLKFVARQLGDSGLLLVATYRDVELGRHHPLARTLGELAAVEQSRRVTLRGLDRDAIARFIEITTGVEAPPGLADAVRLQTEGNPFFVGEVVRLLASEGRLEHARAGGWELEIPQGVRDVVGRRLDHLSDDTNEILTLAAAIGREFDARVLERICDREGGEVGEALAEAAEARLVVESRKVPGRYSFSHALVRETLYAEIGGPRRVETHRKIAHALEDAYGANPEPHLAELAHHFVEAAPAGEAERAIGYASRAARAASAQLAHEDAVEHYQRALEVLDLADGVDEAQRLELTLCLGEAETKAGRFVDARGSLERGAAMARKLGDDDALARAALGVEALSEAGKMDQEIVSLLEEALAAVGEEDSAMRSQLLSGLAQEIYFEDPAGRAEELGREAAEMARRIGDERSLAIALTRLQFGGGVGPEGNRERLEYCDEMLDIARRLGDRELELRAHVYRLRDLLERGDVAGVDRELELYSRLAAQLRQPQHQWHVPLLRGMRALIEGRFEDAERLAGEALAGGERAQEPLAQQFYAVQLALLRRHQGRMEELLPAVKGLAERYPAITAWRCALADIYAESDRLDEARGVFETLAGNDFSDIPFDANYPVALSILAETAALLGDRPRAEKLYELLLPQDGMTLVAGRAAACYGPVAAFLGRLAATMGRTREAERHFDDALRLCASMGERPFAATVRFHLAEMLAERDRRGDRERALELLGQALNTAQELGMRRLIERALAARLEAQGLTSLDVTTSIDFVASVVESERPEILSYVAEDGSVTILFSDIEDSTLMTERLGDEAWLEILRGHNAVFREQLGEHGGYEVKSQGDGFMIVFPSPEQALDYAVAVQREFAREEVGGDERIKVRMGLHTGEAIRDEGDFFGKNVILAARIAAQAKGGEILVSSSLKDLAEQDGDEGEASSNGELSFDDGREVELKGLAGTHRVYRAEWEERQPA